MKVRNNRDISSSRHSVPKHWQLQQWGIGQFLYLASPLAVATAIGACHGAMTGRISKYISEYFITDEHVKEWKTCGTMARIQVNRVPSNPDTDSIVIINRSILIFLNALFNNSGPRTRLSIAIGAFLTVIFSAVTDTLQNTNQILLKNALNKKFNVHPNTLYHLGLIYGEQDKSRYQSSANIEALSHAIINTAYMLPLFVSNMAFLLTHMSKDQSFWKNSITFNGYALIGLVGLGGQVALQVLQGLSQTKIAALNSQEKRLLDKLSRQRNTFKHYADVLLAWNAETKYDAAISQNIVRHTKLVTDKGYWARNEGTAKSKLISVLLKVISYGGIGAHRDHYSQHPEILFPSIALAGKILSVMPMIKNRWQQVLSARRFNDHIKKTHNFLHAVPSSKELGRQEFLEIIYDPKARHLEIENIELYKPPRKRSNIDKTHKLSVNEHLAAQMKPSNLLMRAQKLTFEKGLTQIVGKSGTGKSTLFKTIWGMHNHVRGMNNKPCRITIPANKEDCFYLPQNTFLPETTLLKAILFPKDIEYFENKEKLITDVKHLLKKLGLSELTNSLFTESNWNARLSRGQLQRIFLLKAFILKPKVLFLDEIAASIDQQTACKILKLLMETLDDDAIVCFISHKAGHLGLKSAKILELKKEEIPENNKNAILFSKPSAQDKLVADVSKQKVPQKRNPRKHD